MEALATDPVPPPVKHLLPESGTRLGPYELIRELGRGGMGVVYLARDTRLGRRVAIKMLNDASREVADRFLAEARATAKCEHDHIVIIHDVDEHAGAPYMVLELLEGRTLRDVLRGPISPSRAIEIMLPIARALACAHGSHILHRDLKPENVFVTTGGKIKVLDFGIAVALAETTAPIDTVGTPPYMAPEQLRGDPLDHRCDLWAAGIMMFEMLAGRYPIAPPTRERMLAEAASAEPMPSLATVAPGVSEELAAIVDGCLRKAPGDRLADANELVQRLAALVPTRRTSAAEHPYLGLRAFEEGDADRFFGRERDLERVLARVREQPLVAIAGPSGVGKSSFVRAAIGPALKDSAERWQVIAMRPARSPLAALARAVQTDADLAREPGALGVALRELAARTQTSVLLFVDQFEELYTLVPDAAVRHAFTQAIAAVTDDANSPLRVIVSIRSDFLDRVAADPQFGEALARGITFLAPPDRDGLREAIVAPLSQVGYRFERASMVDEMLDALEGVPGALPLLQAAATRLWEARDRERKLLTAATYTAIGGITGALATHADEVLATLDPEARGIAKQIICRLVTPERTRVVAELEDFSAGDGRVIDRLVAARLLVMQGESIELVHESLIDRWPTLRGWLDADHEDNAFRAQLASAAKQWDTRGRPAGLLWRGEAMADARRWEAQRPRALPARDRAFLDAVLALDRRRRRARRFALVATFAVLGAIAGGASIAYVRVRAAEQDATKNLKMFEDEARRANAALEEERAEEAARLAAEREREQADAERREAEGVAQSRGREVRQKDEQLAERARRVEAALADARKAAERAQLALERAESSERSAHDAKAQLEQALAKERAKVKELERVSTKLK